MIHDLSNDEIIHIPVSSNERVKHMRSRKGYHIFLSWYFVEFNSQSEETKLRIIPPVCPTIGGDIGGKSLDSNLTPPGTKVCVSRVKKDAFL